MLLCLCGNPVSSQLHEVLVLLFRNRPELAPLLLAETLQVRLPAYGEVRIESADLTDVLPAEYRADLVILLLNEKPVLGIIVEVQLSPDDRKRFSWPVYVAGLRARLHCDCCLLVVTADIKTARWASSPITTGPGGSLTPLVIGPDGVPVVTDAELAHRFPELAILSVMAHGQGDVETAVKIAKVAAAAAADLDSDSQALYSDWIETALGEAARKAFQMLPETYKFQGPSYLRGRTEGRTEGRRETLTRQLITRFGPLPSWASERVEQASDEQLETYLDKILTAPSLEETLQQDG